MREGSASDHTYACAKAPASNAHANVPGQRLRMHPPKQKRQPSQAAVFTIKVKRNSIAVVLAALPQVVKFAFNNRCIFRVRTVVQITLEVFQRRPQVIQA
jgi:hypothetical protein